MSFSSEINFFKLNFYLLVPPPGSSSWFLLLGSCPPPSSALLESGSSSPLLGSRRTRRSSRGCRQFGRMSFRSLGFWFRTLRTLVLLLVPPCLLHPDPCHLQARTGRAVRVGALLPAQRGARAHVQAALSRAAAALSRDPDQDPDPERINFLPYNLSLELVSRQVPAADPESLLRCVCERVLDQGVSAMLVFPQNRAELLQVDLVSSVLGIPFISVIEHGEPLRAQVPSSDYFCARSLIRYSWSEWEKF